MSAATAYKTYQSNHFDGMSPKRLILMLYDGALRFLSNAKEGVLENQPQKRGENLGKAIAIIGELQASLNPNMKDEATEFLRGLYGSILTELPKASLTNDLKPIEQTERYISQLRKIWLEQVMPLPDTDTSAVKTSLNAAKTDTRQKSADSGISQKEKAPAPPTPAPTNYGIKGQAIRNYGRNFTA